MLNQKGHNYDSPSVIILNWKMSFLSLWLLKMPKMSVTPRKNAMEAKEAVQGSNHLLEHTIILICFEMLKCKMFPVRTKQIVVGIRRRIPLQWLHPCTLSGGASACWCSSQNRRHHSSQPEMKYWHMNKIVRRDNKWETSFNNNNKNNSIKTTMPIKQHCYNHVTVQEILHKQLPRECENQFAFHLRIPWFVCGLSAPGSRSPWRGSGGWIPRAVPWPGPETPPSPKWWCTLRQWTPRTVKFPSWSCRSAAFPCHPEI